MAFDIRCHKKAKTGFQKNGFGAQEIIGDHQMCCFSRPEDYKLDLQGINYI